VIVCRVTGVVSCPYPAVSNADERNLDFFLSTATPSTPTFSPAVPVAQATTLQEYRAKQSGETRFGLNTLGDLRTSTSILATIDDHEVINDFAGLLLTLTPLWQR